MNYDIFISYRRRGGHETAKHLYDLLTRDGYTVSFDIDTLRNGDFDTELLKRIDECQDFILILDRHAFDRSVDPTFTRSKDWLRNELAYAIQKKKNIIPILLEGFTEFPENLPEDITQVRRKNGPKYDQYYFDDFYRKLKHNFLETPAPDPTAGPRSEKPAQGAILRIHPDTDCRIEKFGETIGSAMAGSYTAIHLRKGKHLLEFISLCNERDHVTLTYTMEDNDMEDILAVELIPVAAARVANGEYEGELRNGVREGHGVCIYPDGERYEGQFANNKQNGKGVSTWPTGERYEGDLVDNKQHGKGIYIWPSGDRYEGDWDNGKRTGKGVYRWTDGSHYEGDFINNEQTGKGIYTGVDDTCYEGDFINGIWSGKGRLNWPDGASYEGDWDNGNRTGKGVYRWTDGSRYEGDFINNEQTGKGIYTEADGICYEGDFINGVWSGKGKLNWPDGATYEGDFAAGKRTGKGVYRWTDGSSYEGDLIDGNRTGKGVYRWTDGSRYEGDFVNNVIEGRGVNISKDGSRTEGRWHNDNFIGQ